MTVDESHIILNAQIHTSDNLTWLELRQAVDAFMAANGLDPAKVHVSYFDIGPLHSRGRPITIDYDRLGLGVE